MVHLVMAARVPPALTKSEESKKRKRDDMENESGDSDLPTAAAKRAKPEDVAPASVGEDGAKNSKVAALLAKRRAIQEQKAAMEQQISAADRDQREREAKYAVERQVRERTALSRAETPVGGSRALAAGAASPSAAPQPAPNMSSVNPITASLFDLESIPKYQSTLKANLRFQQESDEKKDKVVKKPATEKPNAPAPRAKPHPAERQRRPLVFAEPGTYIRKAEEHRNFLEAQAKFGLERAKSGPGGPATTISAVDATPDKKKKLIEQAVVVVEWWDAGYLENGEYTQVDESKISSLIDHPVLLEPPSEKPSTGPIPLKLTPAEQKRLRKKLRAERLKGHQDRVMLGLEPAPKPRVRLANMMRVMGSEAIQDPTAADKMVRMETAAREKRHDERNAARKLTPEQRKEKLLKKFQEDTSLKTSVAIFRVESITSGKHRFKVEMNAQQLHLTGAILAGPNFALIIAEGGPKGIKKFKKLMERRIKWDEKDDGTEFILTRSGKEEKNKSACIWSGEVLKSSFKDFRMHTSENDPGSKKFLAERGVGHYWDMATVFEDKQTVS